MSAVEDSAPVGARPMREVDLDDVQRIEHHAYGFPWSEGVFRDCIRVGYSCWVVIADDETVGYGIMSVAAGEAHILNLCIGPDAQCRGYGQFLLRHLCAVAANDHGADTVILEVRPSNHTALRLYERHDFVRIGIRRGYYPDADGREDAFVLSLRLEKAGWLKSKLARLFRPAR
ncbi:MAG: ribosomal protein S18-alanine N-acetyltransferase [Pseudomonadota bacterium]